MTFTGFKVRKALVTRLMRCAKHQTECMVGKERPFSRQFCSTSLFKCVVIPLTFPTIFAAPSVATETNLSNRAFLSSSFSKMKPAISFLEETVHKLMKMGISKALLSNENLPMQEIRCWFRNSAVSTAIEKKRHSSINFYTRCFFSLGLWEIVVDKWYDLQKFSAQFLLFLVQWKWSSSSRMKAVDRFDSWTTTVVMRAVLTSMKWPGTSSSFFSCRWCQQKDFS